MAGTIPLSLTQQLDEFGQPLSGGLLYIIQAGTVATPQQPYQDVGLTILQPNPIPLDAAGRIPQFFVADGFIKFRLVDKNGVQQRAQDGVLVIGPSSGGGGGGTVDPTTLIQTGMLSVFYGTGPVAGFVRANARTIGNAGSGATERANADTQALWIFLYTADINLAVSGGRTGNALNDYNASKQLTLPDWRGRTISGLDDMGNVAAGRLTTSYWGGNGIVLGQSGGAESNLLDLTRVPAHDHDVFAEDTGHFHNVTNMNAGGVFGSSGGGTPFFFQAGTFPAGNTDTKSANITIGSTLHGNDKKTAQRGGGLPHANMPPSMLATIYLKL